MRFAGWEVRFVVEGCTGWRFVVEELQRVGIEAHLAEPADAASARGSKRRAKTDRTDAAHLRELLTQDRVPGPARSGGSRVPVRPAGPTAHRGRHPRSRRRAAGTYGTPADGR